MVNIVSGREIIRGKRIASGRYTSPKRYRMILFGAILLRFSIRLAFVLSRHWGISQLD